MNFLKFLCTNKRWFLVLICILSGLVFGFIFGVWKRLYLLMLGDNVSGKVIYVNTINQERQKTIRKSQKITYRPTIAYHCGGGEHTYTPLYNSSQSFKKGQTVSLLHKNCSYILLNNYTIIIATMFCVLTIITGLSLLRDHIILFNRLAKLNHYGIRIKGDVIDIQKHGNISCGKHGYCLCVNYMGVIYKSEPIFKQKSILDHSKTVTLLINPYHQTEYIIVRQEALESDFLTNI